MKISSEKIQIVFLATLSVFMVWYLGTYQIIEMNHYMGMKELTSSLSLFILFIYAIAILIVFFMSHQSSPQGIFIGVLIFYSFIWFFAFHSVSGYTDVKLVFYGGLIFLLSVLSLLFSEKYLKINYGMATFRNSLFNIRVELVITALLILVAILMYKKLGISFSFIDSYDRRMIAREEIHGFLAYLSGMSLNGLAPLLAFLAIYNHRYLYLIIALVFVFLGFGFIGTKAPIGLVVMMSLLAFYLARGGKNILLLLVLAMTSLIFLALVEYLLFDYSWISDIYIRRALLVVPQIQMYFLDLMFGESFNSFSLLTGLVNDKQVTYVIGEVYMGNPETNANTISFFKVMAQKGVLGYLFNIIFLVIFFSFMAHMLKHSKHGVWLAISTLYSVILLEQSYSTAFITSGIALCSALLVFFNYKIS